jgi:U3 small nucleolar RNA-associated protein 5
MVFTEDGKYILSSAVGERNIAVWRLDGAKKQSASCVLAMEHPAVFLDSRCIDNGEHNEVGICVLAISEIGLCYIWFGNSIDELRTAKPTKISLSLDAISTKNYKGALPAIYAAKLQSTQKPSSGQVFLVYGMLVKPSFQNILVHSGTDVKLSVSRDGILLPTSQSLVKSKKRADVHKGNTFFAFDDSFLRAFSLTIFVKDQPFQKFNLLGGNPEMFFFYISYIFIFLCLICCS